MALLVALVLYFDTQLSRENALADYPGRPAATAGTNWLLIGSDSREGLTPQREAELHTGAASDAGGERSDTMMLVHLPAGGGQPAIISLPRDSYVPIPGHGRDKLNAAFADGGPALLTQTVETATGLHIDHFAQIGLGGFADLVDAVGGVDMCLDQPLNDPKAGLNLQPGCQQLEGPQALGFVRSRDFPLGDLQRIQNQRKLVGALLNKATSPATLFNPFRLIPLFSAASSTFKVDNGDHVWDLGWLAWGISGVNNGNGVTASVPFSGFGHGSDGSSVLLWDRSKAAEMFNALAHDQPVPQDALQR